MALIFSVGMESPNVSVDEEHLGIGIFTKVINLGLVSLVGYIFNKVNGVTIIGAN